MLTSNMEDLVVAAEVDLDTIETQLVAPDQVDPRSYSVQSLMSPYVDLHSPHHVLHLLPVQKLDHQGE